MKTNTPFTFYAVMFVAMFMAASFTGHVSAQIDNSAVNELLKSYTAENDEDLKKAGIISMDIEPNGTLITFNVVLDEDIVSLDAFRMTLNAVKESIANGLVQFTADEQELIGLFKEQGFEFCYSVKGNKSAGLLRKDISVEEMVFMSREGAEENIVSEMPIEDIVALLDKSMSAIDASSGCTLEGSRLVIEMELGQSEYNDMKQVFDQDPQLFAALIGKNFSQGLDEASKAVFKGVKERGYSFALSFKCRNNAPITFDLDF